jgi:hypothetical protein
MLKEQDDIRHFTNEVRRTCRTIRPGSKVLVSGDPFGEMLWASTYILKLVSLDDSIEIKRLENVDQPPPAGPPEGYQYIFRYDADRLHVEKGLCNAQK